eukprot:scaffold26965_cov50-Phaeocystis_antarctica.AAC.2
MSASLASPSLLETDVYGCAELGGGWGAAILLSEMRARATTRTLHLIGGSQDVRRGTERAVAEFVLLKPPKSTLSLSHAVPSSACSLGTAARSASRRSTSSI